MLLASCLLHSAYVSLEELAEDEAEDAALRRTPLLQNQGLQGSLLQQQQQQQQQSGRRWALRVGRGSAGPGFLV